MKNIIVIMSDNRPLDYSEYNTFAACINSDYCERNGYEFRYYQPFLRRVDPISKQNCINFKTGMPRFAAWSKLLSILKAFEAGSEYVVYIDTDAVFRTPNYRIEEFMNSHMNDKPILFFDDSPDLSIAKTHEERGYQNSVCSGFMILENTPKMVEFVRSWYDVHLTGFDIDNTAFYEQTGIQVIPNIANWARENFAIVREEHFNESPGQLVRHLHSGISGQRMPYFSDLIAHLQLDTKKIVNKINLIQFDTANRSDFFNC